MALLDLADIPEEVGSFEALAVWCFSKLAKLAQGRRFPIGEGGALVPACSAVVIEAADGRSYARLEAAIPCSLPDLNGAGSGSWMSAGGLVGASPVAGAEPPPPPPPPPPPIDPLWPSVVMLLHCEGQDGGSVFVDSSSLDLAVTSTRVTTSTTSPLAGSSSALFGYNAESAFSYLTVQGGSHFVMPGDWAFDCYLDVQADQFVSYKTLLELGTYSDGILVRDDAIYVNGIMFFGNIGLVSLRPRHFLLQRRSGKISYFYDGVQQAPESYTYTSTVNTLGSELRIGASRHTSGQYIKARGDEFRLTNGQARASSDFDPPVGPFPQG